MNRSRSSDDHELSHHRISAKSRYSTTSYLSDATLRNALATPAEEDNQKKPKRTTISSMGGINGREDFDDEDDQLLSGLNGSRAIREANKKHAAATAAMNDLEKDINLARSASTSSAASASRDRPWRQASSGAGSSASTSSYATAASSSDRWAQYETEDLAEESRRATSKAVVHMATRIANEEADKYGDEYAKLAPASPSSSRSSQYRDDPLQDNGNSLSPSTSSFNKRSTTDYVKNRLSTLLAPDHRNSTRAQSDSRFHYDDVRSEAMKMLQLADESLSGISDSPNRTTGLFRTSGGGLAMRELDEEESSGIEIIKGKQAQASISGLDSFKSSEKGSIPKFDGTFTIGSHDEEDNHVPTNSKGGNKDGDTPSLWSSRYSVERQLMAITGGLDSAHMLNKMDKLHASREKTKSARGLYRASADAMDGSGEDYVDYTRSYSLGVHLGGVWQWFKGTMWSDISVNYDGTTQSLVRAEKARIKRRRIIIGSVFMVFFLTIIGVLVKKGNQVSPNTVNFYVLSDEPYDMTDLRQLTRDLENLPNDAEFVIHLGNANANEQSQCQEYGFERAASVLKECPVPMFVITGDKDWAACGSEKAAQNALRYWNSNLGQFDKNWEHDFDVHYQGEVVGNFAFLHKGVLFLSVNIVDVDTKPSELTDRHERNVMWTKEQIANYSGDDYRAIVIFGHSHPSDDQGEYFWPVIDQIKHIDKPVLYVHANKFGNFEVYTPFEEAENFRAVQLERQGEEAPMKVTVLDKKSDPFKILRKSH